MDLLACLPNLLSAIWWPCALRMLPRVPRPPLCKHTRTCFRAGFCVTGFVVGLEMEPLHKHFMVDRHDS